MKSKPKEYSMAQQEVLYYRKLDEQAEQQDVQDQLYKASQPLTSNQCPDSSASNPLLAINQKLKHVYRVQKTELQRQNQL